MFTPRHTVHVLYPSIRGDPPYSGKCFVGIPPDANSRYEPGPLIDSKLAAQNDMHSRTLQATRFYSHKDVVVQSDSPICGENGALAEGKYPTMTEIIPLLRHEHSQGVQSAAGPRELVESMIKLLKHPGKTALHLSTFLDSKTFFITIIRETHLVYRTTHGTLALSKFPDRTFRMTVHQLDDLATSADVPVWLTHLDDLIYQRSDRAVLHTYLRCGNIESLREVTWLPPRDLRSSSTDTAFNYWEQAERSLADLDKAGARTFSSRIRINTRTFQLAFASILAIAAEEPTTSTPADLQPQSFPQTEMICAEIIAQVDRHSGKQVKVLKLLKALLIVAYAVLEAEVQAGGMYISSQDAENLAKAGAGARHLDLCPDLMPFVEKTLRRALAFLVLRMCSKCDGKGEYHFHELKRFYNPEYRA